MVPTPHAVVGVRMDESLFVALVFGMGGAAASGVALLGVLAVAFFAHDRVQVLERRLRELEQALAELALAGPSAPALPEPALEPDSSVARAPTSSVDLAAIPAAAEPTATEPTATQPKATEPTATEPRPPAPGWRPPALSPERVVVWLGASIGGFALVVGVLLGLVAVAESGFFVPSARVCAAMVAGTATWVVGAALRGRIRVLPDALAGVGMSAMFGALFAAHSFYDLLGPLTTFALLVAVAGVASVRAVARDARFMAWMGLVGSLLAPVLVSTGNNGAIGLFSYLFLVLCGVCWATARRGWPELALGGGLGAAALYLGWTASWWEPQSAWIAWVAAFALSVPFAALAGRRAGSGLLETNLDLVGVMGGAFAMLALPWLVPIDPMFYDPRSGESVVRSADGLREGGALAVALLPIPLWWAARRRDSAVIGGLGALLGVFLGLAWGAGWGALDLDPSPAMIGATLPLAVGMFVFVGARRVGAWLPVLALPLALTGGLVAVRAELGGGELAALTLAWLAIGVIGARTSTSNAMMPVVAIAIGSMLFAWSANAVPADLLWAAGPALVAIGVISLASLAHRWPNDAVPAIGWLGGLLVGPAMFPALYLVWRELLGDGAIGLLPVALGAHAALVSAVLIRVHRRDATDPVLALAVGLALAGVTFALPIQLQERWLTVGWALEGAALAWLATRLRHPLLQVGAVLLGVSVAVRLLINPWALAWGTAEGWPILNWTLYTWGVPMLALVASARWLSRAGDPVGPTVLRVLSMFVGFALVNVQVSHAFQDAGPLELGGATMLQGMVRSLAWGSWGMLLLLIGLGADSRMTRFIGFAFMMLAAAKVFLYDAWSLPGFVRVGSLLGLGITLLVAAFLFERLVLRRTDDAKEP